MKFNVAAAAASAAFLAGAVNAEDQKVLKDESSSVAEPAATQAAPELPTFTVSLSPGLVPQAWRLVGAPPKTGIATRKLAAWRTDAQSNK